MKYLALYISTVAFLLLGIEPAVAGKNDDAWASCIWEKTPASAANWLALPKAKGRAWSELPMFDRNYAKGPDATLTLNDDMRSDFLALRLEAACVSDVEQNIGKPPKFKSNAIRKSLDKIRPLEIGEDLVQPETHICLVYKDELVHGMTMGIGNADGVRLNDPVAQLRCFSVADNGEIVEQMSDDSSESVEQSGGAK